MTLYNRQNKNISSFAITILIFSLIMIFLFFSTTIASLTFDGLRLCVTTVIPSLYLFMISSDLLMTFGNFDFIEKTLGGAFETAFKMPRKCVIPFLLGFICGFPIGGKCVCDLYSAGKISKKEAELALGICNNTGPAFIIGGIGILMLRNRLYGVILYLSQIISVFAVAFILRMFNSKEKNETIYSANIKKDYPGIANSIMNSSHKMMSVCGCIVFFYVINGLVNMLFPWDTVNIISSSLLEITSAAKYISNMSYFLASKHLPLIAFATTFSGLSVMLQTKTFAISVELSIRKCFFIKLFEGIISIFICRILYYIFVIIM